MELKRWLEDQAERIARRWHGEIQVREDRRGDDGDGILRSFLEHLVSFLPFCIGDDREKAEEIWQQATQLYGSLALRRGLSAGEVVEELQLLRGEVLKLLLPNFGVRGLDDPTPVREILTLNKVLDEGVARASVAYLDDFYFAHLQGSGIPGGVTPELVEEIHIQLEGFRTELGSSEPPSGSSNDRG